MPAVATNILLVVVLIPSMVLAAPPNGKQTNAQKADERRENEAVRKAQQDVKDAQQAESAAERSAKQAIDALKAAERQLVQATSQLQKMREELEARHAVTSGLIAARATADEARKKYEAAGQPILQRLAENPRYRQAVEAATEADQRLTQLRNATDSDPEQRRKAMAEAARIKLIPGQLQREALDAEVSLKPERDRLAEAEAAVAKARRQADQAIDRDPALQAATNRIGSIQQDIAAARRNVAKEERQLMEARQKLAREQHELQQKIVADQKDDNKPKKNKK